MQQRSQENQSPCQSNDGFEILEWSGDYEQNNIKQKSNFQIAQLSIPKNHQRFDAVALMNSKQHYQKNGSNSFATTSCAFKDQTNTVLKKYKKNNVRNDMSNSGIIDKLPLFCCSMYKVTTELSLQNSLSPSPMPQKKQNYAAVMKNNNNFTPCSMKQQCLSPTTLLRKKPVAGVPRSNKAVPLDRSIGHVAYQSNPHPKKDLLASEPSIMDEESSPCILEVQEQSGGGPCEPEHQNDVLTTNAEVSIASEFDYDPTKYQTEVVAQQQAKQKEQLGEFIATPKTKTSKVDMMQNIVGQEKADEQLQQTSGFVSKKQSLELRDETSINWQNAKQLELTIRQQKLMQSNQIFDPFEYFGAIQMPVIPPEDQPPHELITKVFNDPLVVTRQKRRKSSTANSKSQLSLCKALLNKSVPQNPRKLVQSYNNSKQGAAVMKTAKMTKAIKVFDIEAENTTGIMSIPCNIDMTGKQSNCYNVKALTKEKASSAASYSSHYLQCMESIPPESQCNKASGGIVTTNSSSKATPNVIANKTYNKASVVVEPTLAADKANNRSKLASLTALNLNRRQLGQSQSIQSLLQGSTVLSSTQRNSSRKNLQIPSKSMLSKDAQNSNRTLTPRNQALLSFYLQSDRDCCDAIPFGIAASNFDQVANLFLREKSIGNSAAGPFENNKAPKSSRTMKAKLLKLPRTTPASMNVSANNSPVNLKADNSSFMAGNGGSSCMSINLDKPQMMQNLSTKARAVHRSQANSQTSSQLKKLLEQVYTSQKEACQRQHTQKQHTRRLQIAAAHKRKASAELLSPPSQRSQKVTRSISKSGSIVD